MTKHGDRLNSELGSPNVWIGGQRAWRAVDFHTCSQSDGPKAHAGGFARGSSKVFINRSPAVRKDDEIEEKGASNSITGGCSKVQIGD